MKIPYISFTIHKSENPKTFFFIINPGTFILSTITINKNTITISFPIFPFPSISIKKIFMFSFQFIPSLHTNTILFIIFPLSSIFLSFIIPYHKSITMNMSFCKIPFIYISTFPSHFTKTINITIFPFTIISYIIFCHYTISMF